MAAEWAMRLTPEPFRDFLPYTSLSALKVIHAANVLERALEIVKHYGSAAAHQRAVLALSTSLRGAGVAVELASSHVSGLDVSALDSVARKVIGSRVLALYFHQLQGHSPWFLDLRPRHFAWDDAGRRLTFFPSGLYYSPETDFRRRVQALYAGFYQDDAAALAKGIELYGWRSRPSAGFTGRIERLLREHFGASRQRETRFSIAHFRATFDLIFREMAESKAKLHPELTFLGVGLVGLYLTLEQLDVPLDPRQAFAASASLQGSPETA
jgi:predicted unusual protein kinase regulating ubiquinone biosynthesis (AarF/ABC1/UbiB family)